MQGNQSIVHATGSMTDRKSEKARRLQCRAHEIIPGGAHTYAKGDDQYPEQAPMHIVRGYGSHVWDVDSNEYIEYGMGLRSVTLGHGYRSVVEAAQQQMLHGSNFTRPAVIEVEAAEAFLEAIPTAEMVKFCKGGSDATSGAIRLARACTGRDLVARCADQPFFSVDDWFIGSTAMNAGIPRATRELTLTFRYNDLDSLRALFNAHAGQIACIIMEAEAATAPTPGYLLGVQQLCQEHGVIFILDELITGFRWHRSGAQRVYGLDPDLSAFGKALANGFSVSALAGKRRFMERGGIQHNEERVFLLSTTHGAETHALAAAIEVMRIYREEPVIEHLYSRGERLKREINRIATELGIAESFEVLGRPCNLVYATRDSQRQPSQPYRTLFLQEMLKHGFLVPSLVLSYAHSDEDISRTIEAAAESLRIYREALEVGTEKYLLGRPIKPVFRKYC
jgi:glutamate-1-semialdehyde 2,1-aminomutase